MLASSYRTLLLSKHKDLETFRAANLSLIIVTLVIVVRILSGQLPKVALTITSTIS